MKILHVAHCFPPEPVGGTEKNVLALAGSLRERGHDVRVTAGSLQWERGFRVDRDEYEGIPVWRVRRDDPWYDRWDAAYNPVVEHVFRRILREFHPDLVHVHHWIRLTSNLVQTAREEGIPAVAQIHDFHVTCPRTFRVKEDGTLCEVKPSPEACLHCVERWPFQGDQEIRPKLVHYLRDFYNEMRCAHLVLAPTESHGRRAASFFPGEIGPVAALPPGWKEVWTAPKKGSPSKGPLRVAHWGNLYDLKGTLLLVRAFRLALEKSPMELNILGDPVEKPFLEELKKEAEGLPVRFFGPYGRKDLENLDADLAVFPSLCGESYSLTLDEACMLGLPMVVSDAGVLQERAGGGAWVVPRGNVEALAEALVEAAEDRALLSEKAASLPRSWKTVEEVSGMAEELYGEVLGGKYTPLPPVHPLGPVQRLHLAWFVQALRLAGLLGARDAWPAGWRAGKRDEGE